ncbi:MAG: xylulokinase [Clostridiales bacterium]|jgi:xylulokinase|nr:xylulokinase [Clostridiales bacterium]
MRSTYLIGIDLGTSGTKTILFDAEGNIIASESKEYPMYQPKNGWAEQDADDWAQAGFATIKAVIGKSGVSPSHIAGIGISGQMHGLVMLDEEGRPLRKSIIWCDQRTAKECEEITDRVGQKRLIEITANPALTGFTASKILWVRNNEPEIYNKCRHILLPKDYLRYRMTGEFATEVSDASGMQLLDVPKRRWSREVLEALDIEPSMLGKVYESPEVTGYVTQECARATGLKAGTPVVGGAGDNAAAALGVGVYKDGMAFTTIGTSGVVYAHKEPDAEGRLDPRAIDPLGRVHTFCCAVPGAWHVMGVTQAAGLSRSWFRHNIAGGEPYEQLDAEAAKIPVGANRLLYLPYLMGERTPHLDPDCRGAFIGLSAIHTKYDMLRAVMEGVVFSLKDCLDILTDMGMNTTKMYTCGGGSKSTLWRQMLADVFRLPVVTVKCTEGPALGVAALAAVGAGIYKDVPEACQTMVRDDMLLEPDPAMWAEYEKYYKIFRDLYPALKDSFARLAGL